MSVTDGDAEIVTSRVLQQECNGVSVKGVLNNTVRRTEALEPPDLIIIILLLLNVFVDRV